MKYILLALCLMTTAHSATQEEFEQHFHSAVKRMFSERTMVSYEDYMKVCEVILPAAEVTEEQQVMEADNTTPVLDENGDPTYKTVVIVEKVIGEDCVEYNAAKLLQYAYKVYAPEDTVPTIYYQLVMNKKPPRIKFEKVVDTIIAKALKAKKWKTRVFKIKQPRTLLVACGDNTINGQSRLIRIYKRQNSVDRKLLNCLEKEQRKAELVHKGILHRNREYEQVLKDLSKYNCSKLSDSFQILVCKFIQRR